MESSASRAKTAICLIVFSGQTEEEEEEEEREEEEEEELQNSKEGRKDRARAVFSALPPIVADGATFAEQIIGK